MPQKPVKTTDQQLDRIEQLSDQHQLQISITRAPGIWIANVRLADGRAYTVQSPADQQQLLDDLLAIIDRALGLSAGSAQAGTP